MRNLAEQHAGLNTHCRYLGPQVHWNGGNLPEIRARRAQARQAFKSLGRLWRTNAPREFEINIFVASVMRVLTSAATVLVLSDKELGMLRTTHRQMLRILLLGKGCEKTYVASQKVHSIDLW